MTAYGPPLKLGVKACMHNMYNGWNVNQLQGPKAACSQGPSFLPCRLQGFVHSARAAHSFTAASCCLSWFVKPVLHRPVDWMQP